jgi:hypothetical protein
MMIGFAQGLEGLAFEQLVAQTSTMDRLGHVPASPGQNINLPQLGDNPDRVLRAGRFIPIG